MINLKTVLLIQKCPQKTRSSKCKTTRLKFLTTLTILLIKLKRKFCERSYKLENMFRVEKKVHTLVLFVIFEDCIVHVQGREEGAHSSIICYF